MRVKGFFCLARILYRDTPFAAHFFIPVGHQALALPQERPLDIVEVKLMYNHELIVELLHGMEVDRKLCVHPSAN